MSFKPSELDSELLSSWIDGELGPEGKLALEKRLDCEPRLRDIVDRMRANDDAIRDALTTSVPERVRTRLAAEELGAQIVPFPRSGPAQVAVKGSRRLAPLAAAASVIAAIAVTFEFNDKSDDSTYAMDDPRISAILESQPSGNEWWSAGEGREVQPVLTFAHEDGRWCREYLLRDENDWRAVACRSNSRWITQAVGLESYFDTADGYRPAGASDSATVSLFIREHGAGIALGRQEEDAKIHEGWR